MTVKEAIFALIEHRRRLEKDYKELGYCFDAEPFDMAIKALEQPEPHWTPCSEGPPEDDDWLIVTVLDERGDTPFRYTDFGWYLDVGKCWIVDSEQRTDVIAWMPLPKPFREDGAE